MTETSRPDEMQSTLDNERVGKCSGIVYSQVQHATYCTDLPDWNGWFTVCFVGLSLFLKIIKFSLQHDSRIKNALILSERISPPKLQYVFHNRKQAFSVTLVYLKRL